jgi:DNA-binding transcriptional LysR family regulator
VRETLMPAGVLPRKMSGVPLTEGLAELAMAGLGVAVMARWAVESHVRDRRLCAVRIGRTGVHRAWKAVRLHRHPEAALIDAFAGLVRRHGPTTGGVNKPNVA